MEPAFQHSNTFDALARRIHAIVTSPLAKVEHHANIAPLPHESPEDWDRLLEEIELAEHVRMTRRPDGSVHLAWFIERSHLR